MHLLIFGSGKTDIYGSLSVLGIIFGFFLSHLVSCVNHLTLHCSAGQLVQQQHAGNEKDKIIMQIIPTTQHILENYDILTILEKNQLWKLVLKKVTVYRSQDDALTVKIYPNLPK